jgi:hypothetical protein
MSNAIEIRRTSIRDYEQEARQRKASALLSVIDAGLNDNGVDPTSTAAIERVEALTTSEWTTAARLANVIDPSLTTRALVVKMMRDRAATMQRLSRACGAEVERGACRLAEAVNTTVHTLELDARQLSLVIEALTAFQECISGVEERRAVRAVLRAAGALL